MSLEYIKCIRCGYCCLMGCCPEGQEDENTGFCKYLVINADRKTSCQLVLDGKGQNISIGKGCVVRTCSRSTIKDIEKLFEPQKDYILHHD